MGNLGFEPFFVGIVLENGKFSTVRAEDQIVELALKESVGAHRPDVTKDVLVAEAFKVASFGVSNDQFNSIAVGHNNFKAMLLAAGRKGTFGDAHDGAAATVGQRIELHGWHLNNLKVPFLVLHKSVPIGVSFVLKLKTSSWVSWVYKNMRLLYIFCLHTKFIESEMQSEQWQAEEIKR
jgi:hypothetical protein